jgi:hypothetical protein
MTAFNKHPNEVGETYWEHMGVALRFAGLFLKWTLIAVIHAFFPFLYTTYISDRIDDLHKKISKRK